MAGKRGLAEEIRAGLETEPVKETVAVKVQDNFLDELWFRKPIRQHVQEFSCVMAIVMCLIAAFGAYKGHAISTVFSLVFASLCVVLTGYRFPALLHPVWKSWMTLAMAIGAVMTKVILSIGWFILMVPVALIMKVVGKRVMDLSYATSVPSYWEIRDQKLDDFKLLERQF